MRIERIISTVDSHTAGEPTRIIVGGLPPIPGKTMQEKKEFFRKKLDFIRTSLLHEPRGHRDMFGAVITPPVSPGAHLGVFFLDTSGYLTMCGHGTIGVATVALELGMIAKEEPNTHLAIDTPAGLTNVRIRVKDGRVKSATLRNVPSFLFVEDVKVKLPHIGEVAVNIAFGGNFFAIIDASELQLRVDIENLDKLIAAGLQVRKAINTKTKVRHPTAPQISGVDLTEISDNPTNPKATARNVAIFGDGQVDRSPCGTGTSAKMASLYAKGKLTVNEPFVHESILGTLFEGRLVEVTRVGDFEAVVPEITGYAYITAFNQFVMDPDDPLRYGFRLW